MVIGEGVRIRAVGIRRNQVGLGIEAPAEVSIFVMSFLALAPRNSSENERMHAKTIPVAGIIS